jgi:hypothetical protein
VSKRKAPQQTSGQRVLRQEEKRRWRRLTLLLVIAISGISIASYVSLSITLNGLPSNGSFPGWVALIQPASESQADKVQLQVDSGADGNEPVVTYTVSACGPSSYSADLLLGDNAQLTNVVPTQAIGPGGRFREYYPLQAKHILLGYASQEYSTIVGEFYSSFNMGQVQLVHINLVNVLPCSTASGDQSGSPLPGGVNEGLSGRLIHCWLVAAVFAGQALGAKCNE